MRPGAFAAVVALTFGLAAPAHAETAAEVRELARRAQDDGAALSRLRNVREVDGRPVDFERALTAVDDDDLDRRLATLASGTTGAGTAGGVADPRREAERILSSGPFDPPDPPRPLRGVIRRLGDWLEPVAEPIGRFLAPVGRALARLADQPWGLGLLGGAVVAIAALTSLRLIRRGRRLAVVGGEAGHLSGGERRSARQLEQAADEREAAGDLAEAYRLRFVAGLLRLDEAGLLPYSPSLTTGELVRTVPSASLPALAVTFDEVAYGGRRPEPSELHEAKAAWPRVLEEARR